MATDPAKLSYEEARNELVQVVSDLEAGTATLEQTIELWERGEALAARCEEWLLGAKERLNKAKSASGAADATANPPADATDATDA